jgi:hypothetical protein
VRLLDAFCVCLLGDEYVEAEANEAIAVNLRQHDQKRSPQYARLCQWLLALSVKLLDPRVQELSSKSDAKIERFAIRSIHPTTSSDHLERLGSNGQPAGSDALSHGSFSLGGSGPKRQQSNPSALPRMLNNIGGTFGRTVSVAVQRKMSRADTQDLEEHDALGLSSSATMRFAFFEGKVLRLQIWQEDGGELFIRLKEQLQDFMDELAKV